MKRPKDITLLKRVFACMKADIVSIYGTSYKDAWKGYIEEGEAALKEIEKCLKTK